jgi:hypothetical protein
MTTFPLLSIDQRFHPFCNYGPQLLPLRRFCNKLPHIKICPSRPRTRKKLEIPSHALCFSTENQTWLTAFTWRTRFMRTANRGDHCPVPALLSTVCKRVTPCSLLICIRSVSFPSASSNSMASSNPKISPSLKIHAVQIRLPSKRPQCTQFKSSKTSSENIHRETQHAMWDPHNFHSLLPKEENAFIETLT